MSWRNDGCDDLDIHQRPLSLKGLASVERPTIVQKQQFALAPLVVVAVLLAQNCGGQRLDDRPEQLFFDARDADEPTRLLTRSVGEYDIEVARSAYIDEAGDREPGV